MKKTTLILFVICILVGCKDKLISPNNNQKINISTDKNTYNVNENIIVSIKNESQSASYFSHCNYRIGFYIEKKQNSNWTEIGNIAIVCLAIYPSGTTILGPFQSYTDTIDESQTGTYRLKFPYSPQNNGEFAESLYSNEFVVQ